MPDYTLYYWPIPFRGQFVRAVLAETGAEWREAGAEATSALLHAAPEDQPVPHMGPPVLEDHAAGFVLAEMPAIMGYLGRRHGLMPEAPDRAALTDKIVADANDVLDEMTRAGGAQMWTPAAWAEYRPRLARWMRIFEETGMRHGLTDGAGHMLGTEAPGLADLATATLWGTMTRQLPPLRPLLEGTAPALAALSDRIAARPAQAALRAWSDREFGDSWCGGEIEESLRAVL